jgi:hypothetical protein
MAEARHAEAQEEEAGNLAARPSFHSPAHSDYFKDWHLESRSILVTVYTEQHSRGNPYDDREAVQVADLVQPIFRELRPNFTIF